MSDRPERAATGQRLYAETVIGTLVYAVVLGFFDDYTDLVEVSSFSTVFLAAFVLQLLTWATFRVKDLATGLVGDGVETRHTVGRGFAVWVVMFGSKFVFIEAIDLVFGDAVQFSGFVAVLVLVAVTTILGRLGEVVYERLGPAGS
jgi:hypothetical protein